MSVIGGLLGSNRQRSLADAMCASEVCKCQKREKGKEKEQKIVPEMDASGKEKKSSL